MSVGPEETTDAATEEAARKLEEALQDPETAENVKNVLRHLGSFTFDPVGTLDEN